MKQELSIKLQTKLSPGQILTAKLIELPILNLEQRIRQEMVDNFLLEEDDTKKDEEQPVKEVSLSDYKEDDPIPAYRLRSDNYSRDDDKPRRETFSVQESFTQNLMDQLEFTDLDDEERRVAKYIIYSLDDDGYLRRDTESLVDDLAFRESIVTSDEAVEHILSVIQGFDPPGVGARNVRECLLLQLKRLPGNEEDVRDATVIVENWFQEFSRKDFNRIMQRTGLSRERMKAAMTRIRHLNPSPGGQVVDTFADRTQQIVPDFNLKIVDGKFVLTMPRFSVPELRVNRKYADELLQQTKNSSKEQREAATFIKQKVDSAKMFIDSLQTRYETLQKTMKAILDYQKDFFTDGDEASLKPMVLKDIAEITGLDISTVSRVANSKFIETPFGIFSLKSFFSEGIEDQSGNNVSTKELKTVLKALVDGEDKHKPLTDDEIVDIMRSKGYNVARRTIAKYRDQLNIPKSTLRREI